jgi:3-dehydrosphinganine reductase
MSFQINEKVALITGGSSGIGLATARLFAAQGADVWLLARRKQLLESALNEVQSLRSSRQQRFGFLSVDVSDKVQVDRALGEFVNEIGLPDIIINSAGVTQPGYSQQLGLDVFRQMMEVNYFGTVHITLGVLSGMLKRGSGYIVNISSVAGLLGVFGYTAYCASKFALRGFSDALRAEVKPHGVHLSIVYPPDTDTPQLAYEQPFRPPETKYLTNMGKTHSSEYVAKAILDGMRRRQYVILPGFETKLWYWLASLSGTLTYPVMDWLIARAQRDLGINSHE